MRRTRVENTAGNRRKEQCNGYLKGSKGFYGPTLPIVLAITCINVEGREPILLLMNQACYYDDPQQDQSLCLPFQAEAHGVTFGLTPNDRMDTSGNLGQQKMTIEGTEIPFTFDGRKMYLNIRCPSNEEIDLLEVYELRLPEPFTPEKDIDKQNQIISRKKSTYQNLNTRFRVVIHWIDGGNTSP